MKIYNNNNRLPQAYFSWGRQRNVIYPTYSDPYIVL